MVFWISIPGWPIKKYFLCSKKMYCIFETPKAQFLLPIPVGHLVIFLVSKLQLSCAVANCSLLIATFLYLVLQRILCWLFWKQLVPIENHSFLGILQKTPSTLCHHVVIFSKFDYQFFYYQPLLHFQNITSWSWS